jgi:hypothetical protein
LNLGVRWHGAKIRRYEDVGTCDTIPTASWDADSFVSTFET